MSVQREKSFVLFLLDRWKSLTGLKKQFVRIVQQVYIVCLHSHLVQPLPQPPPPPPSSLSSSPASWILRRREGYSLSLCSVHCCFFFFHGEDEDDDDDGDTTTMSECCVVVVDSLLAAHTTAATKASSSSTFPPRVYTSLVWCYVISPVCWLLSALSFNSFRGPRDHKKRRKKKVRSTLSLSRREIKWEYVSTFSLYL